MDDQKTQYDTKYTVTLVIVSIITIAIFFLVPDIRIQSLSFSTLALLFTLNSYEAYMGSNKKKHRLKLVFSFLALVTFIVFTIILFKR